MPRWSDLDIRTKWWIGVVVAIVIILIIAGWYGYFSTGG